MNQSNHAHGVFAIPTIERRVVLKASAWSVPVVAVASSVPFAAATGGTMSLLSAVWAPSTTYLTLTLLFEPAPVGVPTVEVTSDDTTVVPVSTAVISGGTVQVVVALPAAASGDSIVLDIASTGYSSLSEQVTLTAGGLDTSFDPGTGLNNVGWDVAVQSDGKIVVIGGFITVDGVGRNCVARLNTDGSLDTSFDPGSGLNSGGLALVLQPDGKIIVAGDFTTVDGIGRNRIARLNTDGSLDTTFDPGSGLNSGGLSLALQSDGKIIVSGFFSSVDGVARARIARLNADGSLDTTFDPGTGLSDTGRAVAVQSDGKIIVSGFFTTVGGVTRNRIARLHG
ncbi:MAG TPA: delta-60 repeat domain-containing protein [Arachnia sp.]|nr:delta-60 repeat domain-containing protein [Arachnia sp.]HMT85680.1 delta-60 repeat domain-containing protein [Arachnia sp.]